MFFSLLYTNCFFFLFFIQIVFIFTIVLKESILTTNNTFKLSTCYIYTPFMFLLRCGKIFCILLYTYIHVFKLALLRIFKRCLLIILQNIKIHITLEIKDCCNMLWNCMRIVLCINAAN